jgi:hypothetical protein
MEHSSDQGRTDYTATAHCLSCDYLLRDLPEHRCPECGRPFNPHDPRSMRVPGWKPPGKRRPPPTFGGQMVTAATAGLLYILLDRFRFGCGLLGLAGWVIWIGTLVAWYRRRKRPREGIQRLEEGDFPWRTAVLCLLALTLWGGHGAFYYSCPHATTIAFGPVGISYSRSGGPCHNPPHHGGKRIAGNWYFAGLG